MKKTVRKQIKLNVEHIRVLTEELHHTSGGVGVGGKFGTTRGSLNLTINPSQRPCVNTN
jgi:hypothetical protein